MYRHYINGINDGLVTILLSLGHAPIAGSRNGDTQEMAYTSLQVKHPLDRYLLLPSRKHNLAAQIAETMWVLAGRNDVGWLGHYLPRAKDYSDDGVVWRGGYGPRLRTFYGVDQLAFVVNLLKEDPGTRRAVISLWDPVVDISPGKDIPCNDWLHFMNRGDELNLHIATRSNDVMWGWSGINFFEWSTLLEIVAHLVGLDVGQLYFSISSLHLYEQHWDKAKDIVRGYPEYEQTISGLVPPPYFEMRKQTVADLDWLIGRWFMLEERARSGKDISQEVEEFPEPMMQSWLRVIQWWWTGNSDHLDALVGTTLYQSASYSVQPKAKKPEVKVEDDSKESFVSYVSNLHAEKHAAYGDSWKKRGEMFSIIPNIARKIDRLEAQTETRDESLTDTAIDLLVYLAKYWCWFQEQVGAASESDEVKRVEHVLVMLQEDYHSAVPTDGPVKMLVHDFGRLLKCIEQQSSIKKMDIINTMLEDAYQLAYNLYHS